VRFTDFYANAPVCTPTRAAFITGRYQQRVGLEWAMGFTAEQERRQDGKWIPEPDKMALGLPADTPSLPKWLKAAGYATAIFGKWHLGHRPEFNPIKHGFDDYFGITLGHVDYYRYTYFDGTFALRERDQPVKATGYLTNLLSDRAVGFIQKQGKNPFFLYVPYNAVHWPFQPPDRPEPTLTKENKYDGTRQDYAAMVAAMDKGVGRILDALEKEGVAANTLVVFSSDNGGERLSDNRPLFNHKTTLWEGGIRVPCLMRWPARLPKGKIIAQPAITMDLTATFAAAAGAKVPDDVKLDGIDLLPILTGAKPESERTLCWRVQRTGRHMKAIRQGDWKFVEDNMVELLFDLKHDIGERNDLAYQHPDIVKRLKKRLADWEDEFEKSPPLIRVR
jgi:arylsulfatase A-like enzyme